MPTDTKARPILAEHGATVLPRVEVDSYNLEIKDEEGFLGDRANKGAFRAILDNWRSSLRKVAEDPLGDVPADELSTKKLGEILAKGDPEAAGIVQGAIEEFAQEFAFVIRRILKLKSWKDTERI